MAGIWYRTGTVALTNGSKRVTETAQLKALDVPPWAFGRGRMNDADAAAREAVDEMGRIWVGTR